MHHGLAHDCNNITLLAKEKETATSAEHVLVGYHQDQEELQ
jgi:hypothetical protein